ncbi:methylated-DNA--[protein]-cysteine S-methyltransferase [Spiroplasma cantharicola]|uniref:Methylated-DNA-[protein]-cysteine S-methyltransferase n=1 Tax=Spiroplasma cantharicola TaxID=362837 RepID=A0A0M4JSD3_9MOLU|nr:methylated-DNA--[protein]-cysteine S-methyltransferase [Spiroplasma cantharicola]ALD66447.1 methylated-DNA-[protein]-cysteine S-methyltransferase [Spiroplasma cantharicola]
MVENILKIFKITMFENKIVKIGIINDKLSYIGFEQDNIHDFYNKYTIRNVIKDDEFIKYINFLRKFENKEKIELDFQDLFLPNLTQKQIEILKELCKLDYGQYKTYSDFAKDIKKSDHTRFIASCMGKNPILLLIPCHRLISKNLDIKYRSGREIKSFLIKNNY